MLRFLAAFHLDDPSSLKRALTTALGGFVVLAVNPILHARGLPEVSDTALELFAGMLATFVVQSGVKSTVLGKVEAVSASNAAAVAALSTSPIAPTSPSTVLGQ